MIDKQIASQQNIIDRSQNTLDRLDAPLDKYIDIEYVTRVFKRESKTKRRKRGFLNLAINNAINEIAKLTEEKGTLQLEQDKIEVKLDLSNMLQN